MTHSNPWTVFFTLLLSCFVTVEAAAFQTPAMPTIARHFGVNEDVAAMIALLYYLSLVSFAPVSGRLADTYGKKKVIVFGLALFTVSEFAAALSTTFEFLLAARFLQGLSVACIVPILLSFVAFLFPKEKRGMPLGVFTFAMALGGASGAILGGLMIDILGWRSIYWISGGAGLLGLLLVLWKVPETPVSNDPFRVDWLGSLWLLVGVGALISLPTWISHFGFMSIATLSAVAIAVVGVTLLWHTEKKAASPIVDIEILKHRAFILPCLIYLLFLVCHNGSLYTLVFYINYRPEGSATQVGVVNTFAYAAAMVAGLVSGRLVDILSERTVILLVIILVLVGLGFYATIRLDTPLPIVIAIASLLGFAQGLKPPAIAKLALSTLPPSRYGSGSGIYSMMRDLGSPAGIAVGLALFTFQRTVATERAVTEKMAALGLQDQIDVARKAIGDGKLDEFPEFALRLGELGIDFDRLKTSVEAESLSTVLPVVSGLLMGVMLLALVMALLLPKKDSGLSAGKVGEESS